MKYLKCEVKQNEETPDMVPDNCDICTHSTYNNLSVFSCPAINRKVQCPNVKRRNNRWVGILWSIEDTDNLEIQWYV